MVTKCTHLLALSMVAMDWEGLVCSRNARLLLANLLSYDFWEWEKMGKEPELAWSGKNLNLPVCNFNNKEYDFF